MNFAGKAIVVWVFGPFLTLIKPCFHLRQELIQFMQIDVGKDGRDHTTLRCTAIGSVIGPIIHISSLQHTLNQADKPLIINLLSKKVEENAVIDIVKEADNIHINQPLYTVPGLLDMLKSGMARVSPSEAMRERREDRFVYAFQKEFHHSLDQFVARCRDTQRSRFTVGFGNMDSAYGGKPVVAAHDLSDDPFDALDRKAIEEFRW